MRGGVSRYFCEQCVFRTYVRINSPLQEFLSWLAGDRFVTMISKMRNYIASDHFLQWYDVNLHQWLVEHCCLADVALALSCLLVGSLDWLSSLACDEWKRVQCRQDRAPLSNQNSSSLRDYTRIKWKWGVNTSQQVSFNNNPFRSFLVAVETPK